MKNYELIKSQLVAQRTDLRFDPRELENLDLNHRKEIESLILAEIKRGNSTSFKYIPFLKTVDIQKELTQDVIEPFDEYQKAEVYRYLFIARRSPFYLSCIINLACVNVEVYGLLINLYDELEDGTKVKYEVLDALVNIKNRNHGQYQEMYDKRLASRSDLPNPNDGYNDPMIHLKTQFSSEAHKKQVLSNLIALRDKLIEENRNKKM